MQQVLSSGLNAKMKIHSGSSREHSLRKEADADGREDSSFMSSLDVSRNVSVLPARR